MVDIPTVTPLRITDFPTPSYSHLLEQGWDFASKREETGCKCGEREEKQRRKWNTYDMETEGYYLEEEDERPGEDRGIN